MRAIADTTIENISAFEANGKPLHEVVAKHFVAPATM
jgi:hypothetical protein